MYRVLIADDDYEDRELLKKEISRALAGQGLGDGELRFYEAPSVKRTSELLNSRPFDLLTLDIEFDRLNEGLEVLPEIFENYPTLNIIIISGKLNKAEISERLFSFTKDNVLKGKRWARHFDVLDKKDDKEEALRRAFEFSSSYRDDPGKLRELFARAEGHMALGEIDKCVEVYEQIQAMSPGERESRENIGIFKGDSAYESAVGYLRRGEKVVAALLLGHYIETRLKAFTKKALRRQPPGLYDCLKELERARRVSPYKKSIFQQLLKLRNKSIHHPGRVAEDDYEWALKNIKLMESKF